MSQIAQGIFTLICGVLICGGLLAVCGEEGQGHGTLRMLCGLFLVILALSPLKNWDFSQIHRQISDFRLDAESVAADGAEQAAQAEISIITRQCEAYILDKAAELGAAVTAVVTLDQKTRCPCAVSITGDVTPYEKQMLSGYITQTLGIEKEAQDWNT